MSRSPLELHSATPRELQARIEAERRGTPYLVYRDGDGAQTIVALGIVPFWFATQKLGDVQSIVVEQAKFIASFFFVPVVVGLNWRRGTKEGAIWSMVAGFTGCLLWTFTFQRGFASHRIDAVEVGVALSAITFILVSRATRPSTPSKSPLGARPVTAVAPWISPVVICSVASSIGPTVGSGPS